jgi:hypothetical protein
VSKKAKKSGGSLQFLHQYDEGKQPPLAQMAFSPFNNDKP